MFSSSTFWHKTGAWLQLLTGLIHGASLLSETPPANETERQLIELMQTYKMDLGAGFHRTFEQVFASISLFMTFSLLFAAAVNFVLAKSDLAKGPRCNILLINFLYSLAGAIAFYFLAFLPPFLCLLLIALAFGAAFFLKNRDSF